MSQTLLGEGKDSDSPYDRMDEINRRFREDKPALARYNLQDCRLVTRIFEHTHLTEFLLARAAVTGLAPDRMGGSVAAFTHLYLPPMHRKGYVAPDPGEKPGEPIPGGFVMDSALDYMTRWWCWILKACTPPLSALFSSIRLAWSKVLPHRNRRFLV